MSNKLHYRVMWNYGGIWQACERTRFKSLDRAIAAARECQRMGGAPHRIWAIAWDESITGAREKAGKK